MTVGTGFFKWVGTKSNTKEATENQTKQLPPYNVVLMNDDDHTYQYVIQMLQQVFGYTPERGYQLAKSVDSSGKAIIFTSHKELAELKRELVLAFGTDHRIEGCKGSMSAFIQPA